MQSGTIITNQPDDKAESPHLIDKNEKKLTPLEELSREITALRQLAPLAVNDPARQNFIKALEYLYGDLTADLIKQIAEGQNNRDNSPAMRLAKDTVNMLRGLKQQKTSPQRRTRRTEIIQDYKRACKAPCFTIFLKSTATVVAAGLAFVIGGMIGLGMGILAGSGTGPGALVVGGVCAISVGYGVAVRLFNPPKLKQDVLTKDVNAVILRANRYNLSAS